MPVFQMEKVVTMVESVPSHLFLSEFQLELSLYLHL